jgi:hypothetical protein
VLRVLGGRLLAEQIPRDIYFFRSDELDVVANPNGITLQGEKKAAARAHGWICETATLGPGLQTVDAAAQALEHELKDIWAVFRRDRRSHTRSAVLRSAIHALSKKLEKTNVDFDDWQVLYREILQVARAIEGEPQLFQTKEGESMAREFQPGDGAPREGGKGAEWPPRPGRRVAELSTPRLVAGLTSELRALVLKEIELAKAELRIDLRAERKAAKSLGIAAVAALCGLNLLFVAAALLLSRWLSPPLAASIIAAVLFAVAVFVGLRGKAALVKPMETTRKTLSEDWTWAKNRIA